MNITLCALAVAIFLAALLHFRKNRNNSSITTPGTRNSHITSILCYIAFGMWLPVRKFICTQRQRMGGRRLSIKKKKSRSVAGTAKKKYKYSFTVIINKEMKGTKFWTNYCCLDTE